MAKYAKLTTTDANNVDYTFKAPVSTGNGITLQQQLVSGTNIKTINDNSILGSGNLEIDTNLAFPSSWNTYTTSSYTTKQFCDVVNADSSAVVGKSYLGEVRFNDLPSTLVNAEIIVEIMQGSGTSNKVIHLILSSGNLAPYKWEYTYWNNGSNVSGWIGFQNEITSTNKLSSDLVDDTNHTHKFVTASDITTWNGKQDALTFDSAPTENSTNPVTSGGVYTALTDKQDTLVGSGAGQNIKTINNTSVLGTGNIDTEELFECTSGTTTYTEVETAVNSGKIPYVIYNSRLYFYYYSTGSVHYFTNSLDNVLYYVTVNTSNSWSFGGTTIEKASNKVTSISASSTDTQYPSAKCVYDELGTKSKVTFVDWS